MHKRNLTEFAKNISTDKIFCYCSCGLCCSNLDTSTAVAEKKYQQIFHFLLIQNPPTVSYKQPLATINKNRNVLINKTS